MEDGTEYVKLPVEERCVHKLWKARLHGYEEAAKVFRQIDDEKSPEFNKFLGLVQKFVVDSNAVAQEKGLEAVLAFVENSAASGKTVREVVSGVIAKCIAAPKAKTRELAVQIILMYIEIEKFEAVQEEILKGMEHKNPKIVTTCVSAITEALREFGPKVVNIKPLIKKMPVLLEDRDKCVRDEGKVMVIEIYRWIGDALKSQLAALKPVQVSELEVEFEKMKGEKAVPSRYLKSQQQKQAKLAAEAAAAGNVEGEVVDEEGDDPDVDPYELLEPVDILSKLPKDFYEKIEASKWQERKEAVDSLEQLLQAPKLESGDYGDVVRALKKIISKDSNVMVVATAGKCLARLASGLKKKFQPYAGVCIPCILEKFREKKQNVVIALREAIDAVYLSTTIEAIQEDVLTDLENKNPHVKSETAYFLARCFTKCTPMMLNKKLLKVYTTALLKKLNEPDPTVRDSCAEALGTAMKVVGEKQIMVFLTDLDNFKMTKIKECCDKAVIIAKVPKSYSPSAAPAKLARGDAVGSGKVMARSSAKPAKRPATAGVPAPPKKTQQKRQPAGAAAPKAKSVKSSEKDLSEEEVDEKAAAIFSEEIISGLSDADWKTRLSAVEQLTQSVVEMETEIPTQVVIRILNKKPGLKDGNFQVLKARLEAVKLLAENAQFTSTVLGYCITDIADKLGDIKNGTLAAETLTSLAEATNLELVATEVMNFAAIQKSPKVQQEALVWLSTAIREFGFQSVQPKPIMDNLKKAVSASNPAVRNAAMNLIGTLYLYLGPQLSVFFEDEKSQVQQQIQEEFDKLAGVPPPVPIRGLKKKDDKEGPESNGEEDAEQRVKETLNIYDVMPHVDISSHITESLLSELRDRDWKVRNEALQKLTNILNETKLVTNNLGELPSVLAQRLVDSNSKIAAAAIAFCQMLGNAMGIQCKLHVRTLFPGMLQGLGDSKHCIRSAAAACINTWGDCCSFKELFDGEMIGDALKSGSPALRIELWAWLTEKLPTLPPKTISKDELLTCLPHLYANVEDRNADVRKKAQEVVLPFMMHLGYVTMAKATEKLKTGSRTVIIAILDKVRPNLPDKPLPPKKTGAAVSVDDDDDMEPNKVVRSQGARAASGKNAPKGKVIGGALKPGGRKKDEDVDTSPLLQNNNLKNQRSVDEQKLKVLKWNFTTPREEFVDLLKEQMTVANVNKTLMANMFHSDFKFHLKAIDALSEDLPSNGSATVANLDLILKWMTLRFFDTNPSVLLKGLEYLQTVFAMLIEEEYNMFEYEASSFIPYLILKIGDPKDAVRNGVRALIRQTEQVYPATKLFAYVMEGLKSKNARQRTECLEQLGSLIESYGVTVCQPNASAALKEIARQISDRDNSVRNAALNCVVQAYFIVQDKVYRLIGQISDKDLSLLEERIKRAAKNRITGAPNASRQQAPQQLQQPQSQKMVPQGNVGTIKKEPIRQDESPPPPPPTMRSNTPKPRPVSTGPFGLDFELLERIEGKGVHLNAPELAEFDLHDIINDTPFNIPSVNTGYPMLSLPPAVQPSQLNLMHNIDEKMDMVLDSYISNIFCPDMKLVIQTAFQLDVLLQSDKAVKLKGKVDQVILGCVMQLRLLTSNHYMSIPKGDITRAYRALFMLLLSLYNNSVLSHQVSKDVLRDLVEQLITLLVNGHMEELESGESYIRIINTLVLRIIERSDHTNITCALIKLLYESAGSSTPPLRFMELVMKCLWKVVKLFPGWEAEIDFDMVLYDIHLFLKDFPSASWKKRSSDTPVRTIKTILHCMTKLKGNGILMHLSRIDNLNESELHSYLLKIIKTIKHESSPPKKESKSQHQLPKTTYGLLSEIFKKIGSKDQTEEGLTLLYDFKQQHPEADIDRFLCKSSQFFQNYVELGLQKIDKNRRKSGRQVVHTVPAAAPQMDPSSMNTLGTTDSIAVPPQNDDVGAANLQNPNATCVVLDRTLKTRVVVDSGGEDSDSSSGSKNALYYLERLRALQEQAGLDPSALLLDHKQQGPRDTDNNAVNDDNLNKKPFINDRPEELLPIQRSPSNSGVSGVDALRKRLEELKGLARESQ